MTRDVGKKGLVSLHHYHHHHQEIWTTQYLGRDQQVERFWEKRVGLFSIHRFKGIKYKIAWLCIHNKISTQRRKSDFLQSHIFSMVLIKLCIPVCRILFTNFFHAWEFCTIRPHLPPPQRSCHSLCWTRIVVVHHHFQLFQKMSQR